MIALKHKDIIAQAQKAGLKSPGDIKAYAEKTLAAHAFFAPHSDSIIDHLEKESQHLTPKPAPRKRQRLPTPSSSEQKAPPVPTRRNRRPG